jgi:hypothetical protein
MVVSTATKLFKYSFLQSAKQTKKNRINFGYDLVLCTDKLIDRVLHFICFALFHKLHNKNEMDLKFGEAKFLQLVHKSLFEPRALFLPLVEVFTSQKYITSSFIFLNEL